MQYPGSEPSGLQHRPRTTQWLWLRLLQNEEEWVDGLEEQFPAFFLCFSFFPHPKSSSLFSGTLSTEQTRICFLKYRGSERMQYHRNLFILIRALLVQETQPLSSSINTSIFLLQAAEPVSADMFSNPFLVQPLVAATGLLSDTNQGPSASPPTATWAPSSSCRQLSPAATAALLLQLPMMRLATEINTTLPASQSAI